MTNRSVGGSIVHMQVTENTPEPGDAASSVERILQAAEALFSEQGFDAASISAIAERAGVSKANIFHHFSSKNALYLAVLQDACKESRKQLACMENSEGTFAERLAKYAAGHLQAILEREDVARLILRDLLESGTERGKELAEQVFGQNFSALVALLQEGQRQGELRADVDVSTVAVMLIAANVYYFHSRGVLRHMPQVDFGDDPQRYSANMMHLMLHGILTNPQEK